MDVFFRSFLLNGFREILLLVFGEFITSSAPQIIRKPNGFLVISKGIEIN